MTTHPKVGFTTALLCLSVTLSLLVYPARAVERFDKARNVPTDKHPYLFFTDEELPQVHRGAKEYPASWFLADLQRSAARLKPNAFNGAGRSPSYNDRIQASCICRSALYGIVAQSPKHTAAAKRALVKLSNWRNMGKTYNMGHGGVFRNAAIAYDWLYNELSDTQRKNVESFLAGGAKEISTQGKRIWWGMGRVGRQGNWQPQMYSSLAMIGMVLLDKHPDAKAWIKEGSDVMKEDLDYEIGFEGDVYEAYVRYGLGVTFSSIYPTIEALRRVTGEDLYKYRDSVLRKTTRFTAYMINPQRNAIPPLGDTHDGLYSVGLQLLRNASEYEDGLAAWYLNKLIAEKWSPGNGHEMWGTLWGRKVPLENPDTSPRLSRAFAYNRRGKDPWDFGSGYVFLRTGFTRKDDIQFVCQAGGDGGFHGHSDKGGYVLNAYGVRFLGDYFDGPYEGERFKWHHSGEAHNIVLIDGIGQGAQEQGLVDPQYYSKIADLEILESHEGWDYVRMNLTDAYRANPGNRQTRKVLRHIIFMRTTKKTGYFVAIDDVRKDDEGHVYSHTFHYDSRDVKSVSVDDNRVILSADRAKLHIEAIHPSCGFNSEKLKKHEDTFVKLTCKEKLTRLVMMTVLYPVKGKAAAPKFKSIEEIDRIGVEISGTKIVYDKATEKVSVGGKLSGVRSREATSRP